MLSLLTNNEKNDLYLDERGNLAVGQGTFAIAQACRNALRLSLGELPLDITAGIPYLEDVFISNSSLGVAQAYMMQAIMNVDGVVKIKTFNLKRLGDVFAYSAVIITNQGEIEING